MDVTMMSSDKNLRVFNLLRPEQTLVGVMFWGCNYKCKNCIVGIFNECGYAYYPVKTTVKDFVKNIKNILLRQYF